MHLFVTVFETSCLELVFLLFSFNLLMLFLMIYGLLMLDVLSLRNMGHLPGGDKQSLEKAHRKRIYMLLFWLIEINISVE